MSDDLPASGRAKTLGDLRISDWHAKDLLDFPRTEPTRAQRWRKLGTGTVSISIIAALAAQSLFDVATQAVRYTLLVAAFWAVIGWWMYVRQRRRMELLAECAEVGSLEDPLVSVRLQIDGFDYGYDLGRFDFTQQCLYFEGEQMSFTLLPGDFSVERTLESSQWKAHSHVVSLRATKNRVTILIAAVSAEKGQLDELFERVTRSDRDPGMATVLPPLERGPNVFLTRHYVAVTALIGVGIAVFPLSFAISVIVLCRAFVLLLCGALGLAAAIAHRCWIARNQKRAYRSLERLYRSLGPGKSSI